MRHRYRAGLAALVLAGLAACEAPVQDTAPRAEARPPEAAPPADPAPSAQSRQLAAYYARIERALRDRGLLRTDGGGPDTPFTDTDIIRNFERIVFHDEYAPGEGYRPSSGASGGLRKWTGPVRIAVEFGASVPSGQRADDRAMVAGYARRLSRVTEHPISTGARDPNFHVLVLGEDDRAEGLARVREIVPDLDSATLNVFRFMPRTIHCLVVAFSGGGDPHRYTRAIAWIRAEHPDLMRRACIHEEMAQGLGLADDSPAARPSIFNDDDEFALLTRHDEILLSLLYDPALRPGMTPDQARPILRRLIGARGAGPA
ncbi:DUF2927 domain-containing protein [Roseovarius sp. D22-M7]|uniref:DUF2927 domain-containing protein n=1 Tax=Roseovarius sp. D22-M7 TaxID=3127116 RepID=UPI0030103E31